MISRIKLIAAALGLIVASGAIGDASARVIDRTIVKKTVISRSIAAPRLHRIVVAPRRLVLHRFVAYRAPVVVGPRVLEPRIVRAPLVVKHHLALHRTVVHTTIIR